MPGAADQGVNVLPGHSSGSRMVKYLEAKKGCHEMEIHLFKPKKFPLILIPWWIFKSKHKRIH